MSQPPSDGLPFTLRSTHRSRWSGVWAEGKLRAFVHGTPAAPSPPHLAALRDAIARWPSILREVVAYLRELEPNERIAMDAPMPAVLLVRDCGFGDRIYDARLVFDDPTDANRSRLSFATGFPDGYVYYEIVLQNGEPASLRAFCT